MPVFDQLGRRVLMALEPGCARPITQWLPAAAPKWFVLRIGSRDWHVSYLPRVGLWVSGSSVSGTIQDEVSYPDVTEGKNAMKRREAPNPVNVIRPALSAETKILGKLPQLVAHLRDTSYDDGTSRTPGYLWLSNRFSAYEVVLFDVDAGARLAVNAVALDDVLALAEACLRSPETPWLPDKYLQEQLAKRGKKK